MSNNNSNNSNTTNSTQAPIVYTGRFGDYASTCRAKCEASIRGILVIWLVACLMWAFGWLYMPLFLVNFGIIIVAILSIPALPGTSDTYFTQIFTYSSIVTLAISIAFMIGTGLSSLSCALSNTLCLPAPNTLFSTGMAAILSAFLVFINLDLWLNAWNLLGVYEQDDYERSSASRAKWN